jgi:hypothetical protein
MGSLVLNMAAAAILDVGVKRGRLLGEICRCSDVATNAGACFDAARWRVARFTSFAQKGVFGGQGAW